MKILITGGVGYIGSHTCIELMTMGHEAVVFDNLSNSNIAVLDRMRSIVGCAPIFVQGDIRDASALERLFKSHKFDAVIHFAGLKAVGESTKQPIQYWDHNVVGSLRLCEAMNAAGVRTLVFSSSATVYGAPKTVPFREDFPLAATSPYGNTKLTVEGLLRDLAATHDVSWKIAILRYFNPVGAHPSGLIGENPNGLPNNLMPIISQVAVGRLEKLNVFGNDYPTRDGTGVRDFIHVVDLAKGHLAALNALSDMQDDEKIMTVNLGTGRGYSVLEITRMFESVSGCVIPLAISPRRPGDIAESYADPSLAYQKLGWKAELDLERMCRDSWRWQSMNPNGL
ncbi:UDP-glucose 4-epimerase [Azospirillaceae bacterium]